MKGLKPNGFTIVETLIFLAISGALVGSAVLIISGKQNQAEFTSGVRDVENQLQTVFDNIGNGYYKNTNDFSCNGVGGGPPNIQPGVNNQGQNSGCIFIGQMIQFAPLPNPSSYAVYTVVGKQFKAGTTQPVANLIDAKPLPIYQILGFTPLAPNDAFGSYSLPYGITVKKVQYTLAGARTPIGSVGVFSSFVQYSGTNTLNSGSQRIDIIAMKGSSLNKDYVTGASEVLRVTTAANTVFNPDGGIQICLQSGGTSQYGVISIGSSGGHLRTNLNIYDIASYAGADPTNACV